MGILNDISEVVKSVSTLVRTNSSAMKKNNDSLAKKAKEGILQFPAICSNSLDADTLSMASKALERNYATFAQIVYTMNCVAQVDEIKGVGDFINKFHTNIGNTGTIDVLNLALKEALEDYSQTELDGMVLETILCKGSTNTIIHENSINLKEYMSGFNLDILNDLFIPADIRKEIIEENIAYNKNYRKYGDSLLEAETVKRTITSTTKMRRQNGNNDTEDITDVITTTYTSDKNPNANNINIPAKVLDNNELKKANELVPTTLTLRINFMDKNGNLAGERTFNIGVKVTLHPASSEEIINNLCSTRDTGFFKFIRWTTGELSLVKDVLLNLNEIKLDVVNKTAGKSGWFSTFKRLKAKSTILSRFSKGAQGFHPLGTIIISMDETEIIKNKSGLDLTRVSDVKKVMDKFMLLGFVILDPATQTAMFIFDDSPDFEMQPFSGLKREGNGSITNLKELLKVMNRF